MNAYIISKTTVQLLFCWLMVVVLLAATKGVWGQSHRRDRSDVIHHTEPVFVVDSPEKELNYLMHYGYLKTCTLAARRKRDLDFRSVVISDTEGETREGERIHYCSHGDIVRATMKMQEWFKVPQTGVFDSKTIAKMNLQRCGNPDLNSELENDIAKEQSKEKSSAREKRTIDGHIIEEGDPNDAHVYLDDAFSNNDQKESKKVSKLYDLLTRSSSQNKNSKDDIYFMGVSARRKKYLHSYIKKATAKDIKKVSASEKALNKLKKLFHIRVRRSTLVEDTKNGVKFTQKEIRWRLIEAAYSSYIAVQDQRRIMHLAWRMWSEVIPLKFIEDTKSDILAIDVELGFGKGKHMDCSKVFDGQGGEVAHSWAGGDVHFDDAESYHVDTRTGLNLLYVVLHEIGHVLSLNHSRIINSIMFPTYRTDVQPAGLELGKVDRTKVQAVYGVCTGRFNTVFDILKQTSSGLWVYYTYFFRGNIFWMYENRYDRPRYGDPLKTTYEWKGFPDEVDAATQVLYQNKNTMFLENELYVFKGENYYVFNVYNNSVKYGYPRLISEGFPAKNAESEAIPSNLDTVYYDWRNEHMYFIKGEWVYEYDITANPSEQGCCVSKKKFEEVFPKDSTSMGDKLTDGIDAAYFSFKYDRVFFFKNETVYTNILYSWKSRTVSNSLKESGPWSNIWNDICDV